MTINNKKYVHLKRKSLHLTTQVLPIRMHNYLATTTVKTCLLEVQPVNRYYSFDLVPVQIEYNEWVIEKGQYYTLISWLVLHENNKYSMNLV